MRKLLLLIMVVSFSSAPSSFAARKKASHARLEKALNNAMVKLRIAPEIPAYYFRVAKLYLKLKRPRKAVLIYKRLLNNRLIKNSSAKFRSYFHLASIHLFNKKFSSAIKYYKKALDIKPLSTPARVNLGTAYLNTGSYYAAINEYQKVLNNNPNHAIVYYNIAKSYEKLGKALPARENYRIFLDIVDKDGSKSFKKYSKYIKIARAKFKRKRKKGRIIKTPRFKNIPSKI